MIGLSALVNWEDMLKNAQQQGVIAITLSVAQKILSIDSNNNNLI